MTVDDMDKIYKIMPADKIPWNIKEPPELIVNLVENKLVNPCKAIDLGCGAGNYAVYFAKNGFDVTGIDMSETAIDLAKQRAEEENVKCDFFVVNMLESIDKIKETFDFAYDWEVLHHIYPENREKYLRNVHKLLNKGAEYFSVCFSEKSPQFGPGKYRTTPLNTHLYFSSEQELKELFEPYFNIKELKTVEVKGKFAPHLANYVFMEKK